MTTAEINIAVKAARVIRAIDKMTEENPNLKEVFYSAANADEKDKILDLKVIFATRSRDFVETTRTYDDDMTAKLITLAELQASIMARAIGAEETCAFADDDQRSDEASEAFTAHKAATLAKMHKPL